MIEIFTSALAGFLLGGSLILAIGAQNAFILRQALLKQHIFILCLICALSDASLIVLGVGGFGTVVKQSQWLITSVTIGGALFLFFYGALAFRRAFNPCAMSMTQEGAGSLKAAILTCLALTFLNPHVYLDTVILLGGLSVQYEGASRIAYGGGAAVASFVWFFSLGYGARLLVPVFKKPNAWRVLDTFIGIIMWLIVASLFFQLLS